MVKAYLAFMDHSITEQLMGCPAAWHTTAIALSEGGEVPDLAGRVARDIFPNQPRLRKWSAGRGAGKYQYRTAFSEALARHLPTSKVYLFATSSTEAVIVQTHEHLVRELRIAGICQEVHGPHGTLRLRVGPFIHRKSQADHYFEMSSNRALMVLWVAHFVARIHSMLRLQLQIGQSQPVVVDLFFYHDKFAGDSPNASPAMAFFQTLVSGSIVDGNVRSGFFAESDTVDADLLADNVAGLFNSSRESPSDFPALSSILNSRCTYYESSSPVA